MTDFGGPGAAASGVTSRPADDRPGTGSDTWFADCSSPSADDGTALRASWLNGLLGALRTLGRGNGLKVNGTDQVYTPDNDDDSLLTALQIMMQRATQSFGVAGGTANAIALTLSPTPPELIDGMEFSFKAVHDNTDATTLTIAGTSYPVHTVTDAALSGGEIVTGFWYRVRVTSFTGTLKLLLLPNGSGSTTIANFFASASFSRPSGATFTPIKPLINYAIVGGGAAGRNGGPGAGGGAGETRVGWAQVTPGVPISITIGNGAAFGTNGNGGATSLGSIATASGGVGTTGGSGGSGGAGYPGGNGAGGVTAGGDQISGFPGLPRFYGQYGAGGYGGTTGTGGGFAGQGGIIEITQFGLT